MKKLSFLILLFTASLSFGQNCKCDSTFQIVKYHVETNYAGWFDKTKAFDATSFSALERQVAINTKTISDDSLCYNEIRKYISYFDDGHLHLNFWRPQGQDNTDGQALTIEKLDLTEANILTYLAASKQLSPFEGVWENETYKIGVLKSSERPNCFQGVVLTSENENWTAGEVKFTIVTAKNSPSRLTFITGDKSESVENDVVLFKNILDAKNLILARVYPEPQEKISLDDYAMEHDPNNPRLTFPKKDLAVWTFPNFYSQNSDVVKYLLEKHAAELENTRNWIIDLRNNEGGDVRVGNLLLPYLYTKPIVWYSEFSRLTEDNFNKWYTTYIQDYYETLEAAEQQQYDSIFAITRSNFGKFGKWRNNNKIADTLTFAERKVAPEKVTILIDGNTFSSGELFAILARQSDKVVVMGDKSAGAIDYGNVLTYRTNCPYISITLPSSRNNWLDHGVSIDRDKVQPDLYIPSDTEDWIGFANKEMKASKKKRK